MTFLTKLLIFALLLCALHSQASTNYNKVILKLHNKGYSFFALKKEEVYLITGTRENIEMTYNEFLKPNRFQSYKVELSAKGIARDVLRYKNDGYLIVVRKEKKLYQMDEGKFIRFDKKKYIKTIPYEKIKTKTVEKTHCAYCTFNFSSNFVRIDNSSQYSSEISWLPYWRIGDTTGLRLSLSLSPYVTEDDDLKEVTSFALKTQLLLRQYIKLFFFDIGGGSHYFIDYQQSLRILTTGVGYTFAKKRWLLENRIAVSSLYFHSSTINWDETINEYKFGVSISF